jgi:hypothetical protein
MSALLRSPLVSAACAALLVLGAGCDDKKKDAAQTADAGVEQGPQKPVLGGKLGAAVKAAESAQPAASARATDGPPENGVFGPGLGDKAHPPGAPPKVEIVGEGKAPLYTFALNPAAEQKEVASITVRLQGGSIPVEYGLLLKVDKPKDDKGKDEKKDDKPAASGVRVTGKVVAVGGPPQLPRELSDKLGKLKGSEIYYTLAASTGVTDIKYAMPKEADPGLGEAVVKGLLDAIVLSMPPVPSKPVGVGGSWIVTDRSSTFGIDVIRYRVYSVEKIENNVVSLSVQVRQYAAKEDVDLGSIANGQKLGVQQFDSAGASKVDWTPAALMPVRGEASVKMILQGSVGQGQQARLQTELVGRFSSDTGEKKQ